MEHSFNSADYIKHLANELIRNFSYSSAATTPVLVGTAREKEVIRKLELLLPNFVGVGSGCIIDSFGGTSKQMDIVIYEKEFCPVFSINDSPETTYYPCEGVIAVGEVKSSLNTKELKDIFEKIKSVKELRRFSQSSVSQLRGGAYHSYRHYGNRTCFEGAPIEDYDQINKSTDQIYGFALCGDLDLKPETLAENHSQLLKECPQNMEVNLISILNYGLVFYLKFPESKIKLNAREADVVFVSGRRENNFEFLLTQITGIINNNRTVDPHAFIRYLSLNNQVTLKGAYFKRVEKSG